MNISGSTVAHLSATMIFGVMLLSCTTQNTNDGLVPNYDRNTQIQIETSTTPPVPTSTPSPVSASINVNNYSFSPSNVSITTGGTITWLFQNGTHSATGSAFNSGTRMMGQTYSYTFNTAGTFNFVCSIHSGMTGSITVK